MSLPCGNPMMTSHLCAPSVLRTKPVACGYQAYARLLPSFWANNSASLFSKPSLSSSAYARELAAAAATSDTETIEHVHHRPMPVLALVVFARGRDPLNAGSTILARRIPTLMAHAARLGPCGGFGLFRMFLRSSAGDCLVGAGAHVDEDVVEIAHDVRIGAERRHHVLLRGGDVLAAVHHDVGEIRIAHGLERFLERRRVARAFRIRAVAGVAIGVVPAETRIGVPVDGSVLLDLVGRVTLGVVIFSIRHLDH